jgi:hypothetical protein
VGAKARRRCDLLKTDYRHAKQNFAGENQGIKKNSGLRCANILVQPPNLLE